MDTLKGLELLVYLLTLEVKDVCEGHKVEHIQVKRGLLAE